MPLCPTCHKVPVSPTPPGRICSTCLNLPSIRPTLDEFSEDSSDPHPDITQAQMEYILGLMDRNGLDRGEVRRRLAEWGIHAELAWLKIDEAGRLIEWLKGLCHT